MSNAIPDEYRIENASDIGCVKLHVQFGDEMTTFWIRDDMPLTLQRDMLEDCEIDIHWIDVVFDEIVSVNPNMHWNA